MNLLRQLLLVAVLLLLGSALLPAQSPGACGTNTRISLVNTSDTVVLTCAGDNKPSFLTFRSSSFAVPYVILITDDAGVIKLVSYRLRIDFDQFSEGNYRAYILSFVGNLIAKPGMNIFTDALGIICYGLSANHIRISHLPPDGGAISFAGGGLSKMVCAGDGRPDIYAFQTTGTDPQYRYFVTDAQNTILQVLQGNSHDFNGISGTVRIWGASTVGRLLAQPGQDIATAVLSEDCFDLSDNYLEVVPVRPDGGTVRFKDQGALVQQCSNDDRNAQFSLVYESSSPASYAFILTNSDNTILQYLQGGNLDARSLPAGVYRVWGISYLGELRDATGQNAAEALLSNDCFELSGNFATLEIFDLDPGRITTGTTGATSSVLCLNDNIADRLSFNFPLTPIPGFKYALIVTDRNKNVLQVQEAGTVIDFEQLPGTEYFVSGLAYEGVLQVAAGEPLSKPGLASGCFALTTASVSVVKKNPDGGILSFEDGSNSKELCYSPLLNPGAFRLQTTGKGGENYLFLLTDASQKILTISSDGQFDLFSFPGGIYRIYGLSYTGALSFPSGAKINETNFSNECADLSDNFVTIVKTSIEGASVTLQDGRSQALLCTDGQGAVELNFVNSSRIVQQYAYLLTDTLNRVIRILTGNKLTLGPVETGDFRIWGLSFSGTLLTKPGDDAAVVAHSTQCFELSQNFVFLRRRNSDGGALTTTGGSASVLGCLGAGSPIQVQAVFSREAVGPGSAFLLTNASNQILAIQNNGFFAFNGFAPGSYRIWHVAYSGIFTGAVGSNAGAIPLSNECFDLSDNFIAVTLEAVDGGRVELSDETTERTICLGQSSGFLAFRNISASSASYRYVITDASDQVILVLVGSSIDISVAPPGEYRVYGISFTGTLRLSNGANIRTAMISDRCYTLSNNFITIRNERVRGGTIAFSDGSTSERILCPDPSSSAVVSLQRAVSQGPSYAYLVTDERGIIVGVSTTESFDFATLPEGEYRVWGLAYSGTLRAQPGMNPASGVQLVDGCFALSLNTLRVRRATPIGGIVRLQDGATRIVTCTESSLPQRVQVDVSGLQGGQTAFLLTDTNLTIIQVSAAGLFALDTLKTGEYRAWALAYNGGLQAEPGMNAIRDQLAKECFGLSSNFVAIHHGPADAGKISLRVENVDTAAVLCVGGAAGNGFVVLSATTVNQAPYVFLVTDTLNRLLFTAPEDGIPMPADSARFRREVKISLKEFPGGNINVWGLAYTGRLNLSIGASIDSTVFSADCYDLSRDSVRFFLARADGGKVEAIGFDRDTVFVCSGDQIPDSIFFATSSQGIAAQYRYLLTNTSNVILSELPANVQNFENLPFNELRIWGVSFTGEFISNRNRTLTNAVFSNSCFELSNNYITIIRDRPVGGTVSTSANRDSVYFCPGRDGSLLQVRTSSRSRAGYVYALTNTSGVVINLYNSSNINLKDQPLGSYRIYGLSYTGRLLLKPGDTIGVTARLASSCFELSSNFIRLVRGGEVDGQRVSTLFGDSLFYTCPGDGISDLVIVFPPFALAPGSNYTFVITDDQNRIQIPNVSNPLVDFESAAPGKYRIWGLSYTGVLLTQFNSNLADGNLSSDCFDLSDNFITVVAEVPMGGMVSTGTEQTNVTVIGGDGKADRIGFIRRNASPNTPYRFLLTTTENAIIQIAAKDTFDFEAIPFGEYRVWGLAYSGTFLAAPGANAATAPLSDNCFSLSSNFVTINVLPQGEPARFVAPVSSREWPIRQDLRLSAAPNPTSGALQVRFYIPETPVGDVRLQLLSITGAVIQTMETSAVEGMNELPMQVDGKQPGIYLLRLQYRDQQEVLRVVKVND